MITDYDVGVKNHLQINTKGMSKVLKIFNNNIRTVKKLTFQIIKKLPIKKNCDCSKSLPDEYYKHSLKKYDKD